jgi:hypothetical protein
LVYSSKIIGKKMTDEERIKLGLTKKLTYRYAYGSGDIHNAGNKSTYFLRAMARLGLYGPSTEKYFTPDSVRIIKEKEKNPNLETKLINPIYISDAQVPLEDFEMVETGGEPLYEEQPDGSFIIVGYAPVKQTKKVNRPAERNLSPQGTKFGLEGGNGNSYIPQEGTTNDIKKIIAEGFSYSGVTPPEFGARITLAGVEQLFLFDRLGYITVLGVRYSALQVTDSDGMTALAFWRKYLNGDYKATTVMDSWGLVEQKTVEPEKKEGLPDREEDADADPNAPKEEPKTDEEVKTQTDTSSITEKINILRGWVVKNGKVDYQTNGKPKKTNDKAPQLRISDTAVITIESDGSVSIDGDVQINSPDKADSVRIIEGGKFTIPFGKINGNFNCQKLNLTTLANSPKTVNGTFDCSNNSLTTLGGAPQEVGRFISSDNKNLTSLSGGPKKIKGITDTNKSQKEHIYDVSGCGLTSLDGNGITSFGPGGFNCAGNKITSLTGLGVVTTTGVTKFDCSNNQLTSLNGIPKPIKDAKTGKPGDYWIKGNLGVTVFPASMAEFEIDQFVASGLSLTSLSFAPKQIYGSFDCSNNKGTAKLTNQSIGKDRFKIGGGFEEDSGRRIVKIDGDFITSEGIWSDKTYDIDTVFKASGPQRDTSGFFPTDPSGQEPIQGRVGQLLSEVILVSGTNTKPTFVYQEMTHFAIGYGGLKSLKQYTPKSLGTERVPQYQKAAGDESAYVELGTSGFGGVQYQFTASETWPSAQRWMNFSYFESPERGWAPKQPTGPFIINGKNYGAKTGNRWLPVLYWTANSNGHPSLISSFNLFKAKKVAPPHAQNMDKSNYKVDVSKVLLAAPGARYPIVPSSIMSAGSDSDGTFIGKVRDANGGFHYYAGFATSGAASRMKTIYAAKGKTIEWHITGDPGGSVHWNSGNVKYNPGTSVPVIIYW